VSRVCVCICTCPSSIFDVVLQLHTPISRNRKRSKLGNNVMVISEKESEGVVCDGVRVKGWCVMG